MRIEYHRTLIADTARNDAFYRALKSVIVPGKTVVADIGAGTGLLGLMAAKLGAKDVFMFETAAVAGVAAKLIKANRAKACHLIPCHSTEFDDHLAVDVIVSETLGNYALEENIVDTLVDASQRFLKSGGTMIPHRIQQFVAPIVTDRLHHELSAWDRVGRDLDLAIAKAMSFNNVYVRTFKPSDFLGGSTKSAVRWDDVDLTNASTRANRKGDATWTLTKAETIYGFGVWWQAELVADVSLSTAPGATATHWEQLYFPLLEPIFAKSGERVSVSLRSRSSEAAGTHLAWTATQVSGKGATISKRVHDLDKGYLP